MHLHLPLTRCLQRRLALARSALQLGHGRTTLAQQPTHHLDSLSGAARSSARRRSLAHTLIALVAQRLGARRRLTRARLAPTQRERELLTLLRLVDMRRAIRGV